MVKSDLIPLVNTLTPGLIWYHLYKALVHQFPSYLVDCSYTEEIIML